MKYKVVLAVGHKQISDQIKKFDEIDVVDENDDIEIVEEVLEFVEADFAIINTMLSREKSLHFARRAQQMNVKVICITEELKDDKKLILSLAGCGVTAFVQIDELYRIPEYLETYPKQFEYRLLQENVEKGAAAGAGTSQRKTTIAVLGIMPRIGTTTHALGLAKYLNDRGYKTAYIELNDSDYIRRLAATYMDAVEDCSMGKVAYGGLDMYFEPKSIPKILRMPYTFYIYDFGDIHGLKSQLEITWLEKDIKILITGTKPNEIEQFQDVVKLVYPQNTKYLFNFCSDAEREDIKARMGSRADVTFFSAWLPDPFLKEEKVHYEYENMMADALAKAGGKVSASKEMDKAKKNKFWRSKR